MSLPRLLRTTNTQKINDLPWHIVTTEKDGIKTTKKVLYEDDGTEVVNPLKGGTITIDTNAVLEKLELEKISG